MYSTIRATPKSAAPIKTTVTPASPAVANQQFARGVPARSTYAGTGKERHVPPPSLAHQRDPDVMANDTNLAAEPQPSHTSFLNKLAAKFHKRLV